MLTTYLQKLGLSETEAEVYSSALQQGACSAADIAKATGINRTTVYAALKQLQKKGIVYEDITNSPTSYTARDPKQLDILVATQRAKLEDQEQALSEAIELASELKVIQHKVPKLQYINAEELDDFLHNNMETWSDSITQNDGIWWGYQDKTFVSHFKQWIDAYWKQAPKELELRLLSNDSADESAIKQQYAQRNMHFIDALNFTGTTWICGEYIVMIFTQAKPFYAIQIHDAVMAKNFQEIFALLWKDK